MSLFFFLFVKHYAQQVCILASWMVNWYCMYGNVKVNHRAQQQQQQQQQHILKDPFCPMLYGCEALCCRAASPTYQGALFLWYPVALSGSGGAIMQKSNQFQRQDTVNVLFLYNPELMLLPPGGRSPAETHSLCCRVPSRTRRCPGRTVPVYDVRILTCVIEKWDFLWRFIWWCRQRHPLVWREVQAGGFWMLVVRWKACLTLSRHCYRHSFHTATASICLARAGALALALALALPCWIIVAHLGLVNDKVSSLG